MRLFFTILLFISTLGAVDSIDISNESMVSILNRSQLYLDTKKLTKEEVIEGRYLTDYNKSIINVAHSKAKVWIYFKLKNSTSKTIEKVLVLNSPSLEYIELYEENRTTPRLNGIKHNLNHSTIYYFFKVSIPPHSISPFYLTAFSSHKSFFFKLTVEDYEHYRREDIISQAPRLLLVGLLLGLMIYTSLLGFYSRDKSYLYYSFYLFFTIWHQITFLGLTQIYAPQWFIFFDMKLIILKLGFALLFATLYSLSFLKIDRSSVRFKIYTLFIATALLIILNIMNLSTVLLIGVFFVFFNFITALKVYREGLKEARLFIVGFGVVALSYILVVLNSFGLIPILNYLPHILMWAFTIEALVLTLAFADRYKILQEQKEQEDRDREMIIQEEVVVKTKKLNSALKSKELLLKEVHHRVKNNLQIILSIVRMQRDKIDNRELENYLLELENRINAISKSYSMLMLDDNLEEIDMEEYLESLLYDIQQSMGSIQSAIKITLISNATLPLGQSVYVGIIVNELVTNSYKHAFKDKKRGHISVALLQKENHYSLEISDDGVGFSQKEVDSSLGLNLIYALVKEQLKGTIELDSQAKTLYKIEFFE